MLVLKSFIIFFIRLLLKQIKHIRWESGFKHIHKNLAIKITFKLTHRCRKVNRSQEKFSTPFADNQTRNRDTDCFSHHLSLRRFKNLSFSKMKWWAVHTQKSSNRYQNHMAQSSQWRWFSSGNIWKNPRQYFSQQINKTITLGSPISATPPSPDTHTHTRVHSGPKSSIALIYPQIWKLWKILHKKTNIVLEHSEYPGS